MDDYKIISSKEYKFKFGDIVVLAEYTKNNNLANLGYLLANYARNAVVFNLRDNLKLEIEDKLKENNTSGTLYIDRSKRPDLDYIESKCYEIFETLGHFYIIIDSEETTFFDNESFIRLKKLAQQLSSIIFITTDIVESKELPTLEDLEDTNLIEQADVIVLTGNTKKSILVKNKYGETGILNGIGQVNYDK